MRHHQPAQPTFHPELSDWAQRVAHGAPVLLAYLDREQRFRFANDTHRRWLGIDPRQLIGRRLVEVIGERNLALAGPALAQAYAGQGASYEGRLYRGRQRRYAHGNFQPDFDADGQVRGIFTALVDITERRELELRLHESEQRFFSAFQHAATGMALTSPAGRFLRVNAAVCQMLGYSEAEMLALDVAAVTHPDDMATDARLMAELLAGRRESYQLEKRNLHKDGRAVHFLLSVSMVRDDHGAPLYFISQVQDISQRKAAEEALHRERELAEVTLRSIGDAVITTDPALRVATLNPVAEAMTGWSAAEAQGLPIEDILPLQGERTGEELPNPLRAAIARNAIANPPDRLLLRHRHGFDTLVESSAAPIHDHAGNAIGGVLVFHDVSETRALNLKMIHLAQHDALTGLPNRRQLQAQLEQAVANARRRRQRLAVLYIDIDGFKRVNEQHGQSAGDRALRAFVAGLQGSLQGDEWLGRYGGDEFVLVVPRVDNTGLVTSLCRRLIEQGEATVVEGMAEPELRLSIGVSLYPEDAATPDELLQHAEAALLAAKAQTPHGFGFFTAAMNEVAQTRRHIETGLRHALERQELSLYYQPKVDVRDGRIVGAEALLRWHIDGREACKPDAFIPIAEETGAILPIGTWVLREACRQIREWERLGRPVPVSVNVSALQFQQPDFYATLDQALHDAQLSSEWLELELTERMVMAGGDATTALLRRIRRRGVCLSLDDFGTGYSGLSYLKHFPIDVLKIDRIFVRDITSDHDTAALTTAIVALAHSLGKLVVAEGVETLEQSDFLRNIGCHQLQGYFHGRPMPAAEFQQRLLAGGPAGR
jgi:diguanylate cyclase (GGDEF)-like protein/PAS domain S-box-containing protein